MVVFLIGYFVSRGVDEVDAQTLPTRRLLWLKEFDFGLFHLPAVVDGCGQQLASVECHIVECRRTSITLPPQTPQFNSAAGGSRIVYTLEGRRGFLSEFASFDM